MGIIDTAPGKIFDKAAPVRPSTYRTDIPRIRLRVNVFGCIAPPLVCMSLRRRSGIVAANRRIS